MLRRAVYCCSNTIGVWFRLHWRLFLWLGIFFVIGAVLAFFTIMNPKIKADSISVQLIDGNLVRSVKPTASFGNLMFGRIWAFLTSFVLILVLCLSRWTLPFVFVVALYRGFTFVINVFWIIIKFGVGTGLVLLVVYFVLLLLYSILLLVVCVFLMKFFAEARCGGFRGAINWRHFGHSGFYFAAAITAFAFLEYLILTLTISRIVFVI